MCIPNSKYPPPPPGWRIYYPPKPLKPNALLLDETVGGRRRRPEYYDPAKPYQRFHYCATCKQLRGVTAFRKVKARISRSGRSSWCRRCERNYWNAIHAHERRLARQAKVLEVQLASLPENTPPEKS